MRFPKLVLGLFVVEAAGAITAYAASSAGYPVFYNLPDYGALVPETPEYNPPVVGVPLIGDFLWGLYTFLRFISSVPSTLSFLAHLFFPAVIADVLVAMARLSLFFYVLYLVSGRIFSSW